MSAKFHSLLLTECLGTFILVFCGAGAIVIDNVTDGMVGNSGIAMTFGLVVMALIYAIGDTSGAHVNPAVTIAFWVSGRFSGKKVLPYIIVQILGGLLAGFVLKLLFPESLTMGETTPTGSIAQTLVMEVLLTFILMFVILKVTSGSKETGLMAGIAIGGVVGLEALFAGPISGASMNPARSIGPAIVSMHLNILWIYILAPIVGALVAVLIFKLIRMNDQNEQQIEA